MRDKIRITLTKDELNQVAYALQELGNRRTENGLQLNNRHALEDGAEIHILASRIRKEGWVRFNEARNSIGKENVS
jgi:hypothetical protein